ncbi:MAG: heparinase II/III family protein [Dyadobacter sp.]|uniref:heparinase II/III domain-containing protein n=1 Tax=Dyadobacter sp. TaxID=1914288 RepID=UPI001B1E7F19|nr:heparinase II/III family protein [Dyadobacter sp.]MBO9613100.1 heparinase II/III family protein [Dyadobacter sp.]
MLFVPLQLLGQGAMNPPRDGLVIPPFVPVAERAPRFPLKTARMIYREADIMKARMNLLHYKEAQNVRDRILKAADPWLARPDSAIVALMPDARVPRAFDLNPKGSPVHGDTVFKVGGFYPWIVDPDHPLQVKSPIDGQVFPSNDYLAYYRSSFRNRTGLDRTYADDGWGWIAPDGERYWFVAYANQWMWKGHIEPAFADLAHAYLLTGDKRYAHKAAVMLYRLGEVYPSMDHANQSRYGLMEKMKGHTYNGKVLNLIWETSLIQNAAEAYDAVWDSIDGDTDLQRATGKSGGQIRAFIEANVLEDAVDAYMQRKIQGNYGMHQIALLYILLARQNMGTEKYLHMLVEEPGESRVQSGLRYALYNMIFRDGQPLESPDYNLLTVQKITRFADMLRTSGTDLFAEPRLRGLIDSPLEMVATGKITPGIGDSGSVLGTLVGQDPDVYQVGYGAYRDPRYLTWLAAVGKVGAQSFSTFESLFRDALPDVRLLPAGRALPERRSHLLAGYGMGMLNNRSDAVALTFNYGFKGTHYHWDFLNFELFANGQKMMPDLGYPDAMNEYVKEVYTWSFNSVAHNTVVVDAQRQVSNVPGRLHDFADGKFVQSMDASSATYPQTTAYRRNMVMIDIDSAQSYIVDFFRVAGGRQHDYALHGPPGSITAEGQWGEKQPGTLAGEDVAFGDVYDDAKMGIKGYQGSYWNYKGSGYQYLFNVQKLNGDRTALTFSHVSDKSAKVKIHILPQSGQEIRMADAWNKPRAKNYLLKYIITRRKSLGNEPLKSTFVGVMEPFAGNKPLIKAVRKLPANYGTAVEVVHQNARDVVISDTTNRVKTIAGIETDAHVAVVRFGVSDAPERVFFSDGSYLKVKGRVFRAQAISGIVTGVDAKNRRISVALEGKTVENIETGRIAHFTSTLRQTEHPIQSAAISGNVLTLETADDILIGKVHTVRNSADSLVTDTNLPFAPLYAGATMLDGQFEPIGILGTVSGNALKPAGKSARVPADGADIWISNIGVGDRVQIKARFDWER